MPHMIDPNLSAAQAAELRHARWRERHPDWQRPPRDQTIRRSANLLPFAAVDGGVTVQDFLQNFGVGYQALALADQLFQQSLGIALVGMGRSDQVHRNIRVDQNHGRGPVP